jgi:2-polyprenyl-6-methoxyphenol hydroxylase-like FAD-dependent oxidoreductase
MPDGVAALRQLGVVLGTGHGLPFRGIRFADDQQIAEACFPDEGGIGIRRTALHQILLDRAEATGVVTGWRTKVTGIAPEGIRIGDRFVRCRWIIGADGSFSQIRQWAGLAPVRDGRTRGEGRGVHHKVLVACAVEVRHRKPGTAQDKRKDGRYAGRVRLAVAPDRSAESLCGFVESAVAPGMLIVTDDWSGYAGLRKRGYDHHAIAECGDPEVTEEFLPIIHLVFANLKTWGRADGEPKTQLTAATLLRLGRR